MNLYMNVFALVIIFMIFFFYIFNGKTLIKLNKLYLALNITIVISITFDILLLEFSRYYPDSSFVTVLAKIYLITLVLDSYVFYLYATKVIYDKNNSIYKKHIIVSTIILYASAILIIFLPKSSEKDVNGQAYLTGATLVISYVTSFIYLLLVFIISLLKKNSISKRKTLGLLIYALLWGFSTLLQITMNYIVKEGVVVYFGRIASSIGALSIFALIENPENDTESELGFLNDTAFRKYAEKIYDRKTKQKNDIIILSFDRSYYTVNDDFKKLLQTISQMIEGNTYKSFKYDPYTYLFVKNKKDYIDQDNLVNNIRENIIEKIEYFKYVHYHLVALPKNLPIISSSELLNDIGEITKNMKFDNTIELITFERLAGIEEEVKMSDIINYSIKNDRIYVYYQGITSKKNEKYVAAEALVRLKNEDGEVIGPTRFIPMAEADGRIVELSEKIFEHVCKFISYHDLKELGLNYIEVNLSPEQFNDPNLVTKYLAIAKKYNVNPKYINLEITETSQGDVKRAIKVMNEFKKYGFTFSLDDFGTGNSNLNYVIDMPVDIVKFDKTMVQSYFENEKTKLVVDKSIEMIKHLDKKIVFEGIESKKQVDLVKKMDIDFIQGYYYTKPLIEEEFIELMTKK